MEQFHDLLTLSDFAIQQIISNIPDNVVIASALNASSNELRERFYRNMSDSRREIVKEALNGVVFSLEEHKTAQQYLLEVAKAVHH